jgi:hypothetical protein
MTTLQEYDLEIRPSKIIPGMGLFILATKSMDLKNENKIEEENES